MFVVSKEFLSSLAFLAICSLTGCAVDQTDPPVTNSLSNSSEGRQTAPRGETQLGRQPDRVTGSRRGEELFQGIEQRGTGNFVSQNAFSNAVSPERGSNGEELVTLNLLNVPIAQAAKSIIGDVLKANYTIADKLTGTITIQTTSPMNRNAVLDVFESALKLNGAALVRTDGHYRIVAAAGAAQSGARIGLGSDRNPAGTQILVVPLKFVAPSEMKRIIDPITPQGGVLNIDDSRNILLISGTPRELNDMSAMIALFDVDWMRGMSVALYPVKSSDPEVISRELETVLGLDKDGPMKGSVRVIPNKRLSAIMVISSRPGPLETARKWLNQLDRVAETTEEQLFVYKTHNRNATELANLLSKVIVSKDTNSSASGSVAPRFDNSTVTTETSAEARNGTSSNSNGNRATGTAGATAALVPTSASAGSTTGAIGSIANAAPSTTPTAQGNAADTDRTQVSSQQSGSRGQRVVADEANSAILITATRKEYDRILQILERMDVLPTQIMLEALIAEVTLTDELKFGVKWAFAGKGQTTFSDATDGSIAPKFPGFSYFYLTSALSAAIDAISSITKVNVVSAPSLMVLDNRKATLQIGDQVPIVTQSAVSTTNVGAPLVNSVTMKDTGIILNVVPHVSDDGRVVLEIEQEVSNVTRTTSSGIDSPTIQQRRIRTSVVVDDGQVVALGGLIQERDNNTKGQIPLLGDIPILGTAFRQKTDKIDRTELLIFIRPLVVRSSREASDVTNEYRKRINMQKPTSQTGRDHYDRDGRRILR